MNTYDIAIRLTDGSRKTMTVRATTANAAERMVKERYPVGINKDNTNTTNNFFKIMNTINSFWMLYAEGCESPKFKHCSLESAQKEAERLAEKLNTKVYVLQAVEQVSLHKFNHITMNPEDCPF